MEVHKRLKSGNWKIGYAQDQRVGGGTSSGEESSKARESVVVQVKLGDIAAEDGEIARESVVRQIHGCLHTKARNRSAQLVIVDKQVL